MKNKKFYILSFIIPILFFSLVLILRDLLFGNHSLIISDMFYQYYRLLIQFKDILLGNNSLFYTYEMGFGQSFFSTYAYYIASPLNLLILLFNNVEKFINFIIIFKVGLCGLTSFVYFKYHFKKQNSILLVFSCLYALSSQVLSNYFNIMWLDSYYLAPLVLLGIDKLIDKNKSLFYFVTLFFTVTINYYTGYMVCIFSALYFIYRCVIKYEKKDLKKIKKIAIKFMIVSILSCATTLFINLPNIFELTSINRNNESVSLNFLLNLSKIFPASENFNTIINRTYAYLYIGLITIPLLIFYFVNKKVSKKEKIAFGVLLLILSLSILLNPINNIWHGFSAPKGFNYRYYFLFIIVILFNCIKSLIKLTDFKIKQYLIIDIIILTISTVLLITKDLSLSSFCITLLFMIVYSILLYLYNKKIKLNNILRKSLLFFILFETFINAFYLYEGKYFLKKEYMFYRDDLNLTLIEKIKEDNNLLFNRTENAISSFNDSMLYGYNGLSAWYSTLNYPMSEFLNKIGYNAYMNVYKHNSNILFDSLFGLNYYITSESLDEYELIYNFNLTDESGTFNRNVYKNSNALSIGYMVNEKVKNNIECTEIFDCQNKVLDFMTNTENNYYKKGKIEEIGTAKYKLLIEDKSNFYIVLDLKEDFVLGSMGINFKYFDEKNKKPINLKMYNINNASDYSYTKFENGLLMNTEYVYELTNLSEGLGFKNAYLYYEVGNIEDIYKELSSNQLELVEIKDGYIKGNIEATEEKNILMLTLPYEKGWNVKVDGKEIETTKIFDTFLGVELEPGNHEVEFSYETPGLKTGIIISAISLTLYIAYYFLEKNKKL